ncbi:MAG: hypothetical protein IJ735_01675 [Clostridia bacterium]|nr:hypothetical protein [Clostridia bacterium]
MRRDKRLQKYFNNAIKKAVGEHDFSRLSQEQKKDMPQKKSRFSVRWKIVIGLASAAIVAAIVICVSLLYVNANRMEEPISLEDASEE